MYNLFFSFGSRLNTFNMTDSLLSPDLSIGFWPNECYFLWNFTFQFLDSMVYFTDDLRMPYKKNHEHLEDNGVPLHIAERIDVLARSGLSSINLELTLPAIRVS